MPQTESFFDRHTVEDLCESVRDVYLRHPYPWVVGYSGGKDSTATLQLVWSALRGVPEAERTRPVYVIASDTMVESPPIAAYIDSTLRKINEASLAQGLPFHAEKVVPDLNDSFWVNLIGRGYPAPSRRFRWCTERLKIKPANRFIRDKVSEFGKVVMVLGSRRAESATRAQVMALHRIPGMDLRRHSTLPNALVYMPIEDLSTDDVWQYLFQVQSPWGGDNRALAALYRSAQGGECPLVIDDTTPSCGNSRFGCWVCTVVTQDKSMSAMVDHGETWLEPLLDLRNLLAETQNPERKAEFRDIRRRDGKVKFRTDGVTPVPGPYTFEFCQHVLREILKAQAVTRQHDPDLELISHAELVEIQRLWIVERNDWARSAERIYAETTGDHLTLFRDDVGLGTEDDHALLSECARKNDLPVDLLQRLLTVELEYAGMARRAGVYERLGAILRAEASGPALSDEAEPVKDQR